jgi:PadR family transcriptional regulator PadR
MRSKNRKDLFPGALELMVLQSLRQEPRHGYALAQHIKRASNDLLNVEEGSLYPALQRMLRSGWLKARWDTSASGRRVRVYELTDKGHSRLTHEVSSFERMLEGIRLVLGPAASARAWKP